MLSTNISAPVKPIDYAKEDIEDLYRIITSYSYQKSLYLAGALTVTRKNLLEYFTSTLTASDKRLNDIERKLLVGQLDMLIKQNFFSEKFDLEKLEMIKKDILTHGNILKTKIAEDKREEFIESLIEMNNEYQSKNPIANVVPNKLQTGLSSNEKNSIKWGAEYSHSMPGIDAYNKGIKLLNKCEWESAAILFAEAATAERELASEAKNPVNDQNILIYHGNMAYAFHMAAITFLNERHYQKAIENYKKAIISLQTIPKNLSTKKEIELLIHYHRNLADTFSLLAGEYYYENKENKKEAIENYQLAISELEKIPSHFFTEQDEEDRNNYLRYLAYVFNMQGEIFFDQNQFSQAILNYQEAMSAINKIKPEYLTEDDNNDLINYEMNIYFATEEKELKEATFMNNNPNSFFQTTPDSSEEPEEINEPDRKRFKQ